MKYYNSEQMAKIGDLIATCRFGQCKILSFIDQNTAEVQNVYTTEIFQVYIDECDYLGDL